MQPIKKRNQAAYAIAFFKTRMKFKINWRTLHKSFKN